MWGDVKTEMCLVHPLLKHSACTKIDRNSLRSSVAAMINQDLAQHGLHGTIDQESGSFRRLEVCRVLRDEAEREPGRFAVQGNAVKLTRLRFFSRSHIFKPSQDCVLLEVVPAVTLLHATVRLTELVQAWAARPRNTFTNHLGFGLTGRNLHKGHLWWLQQHPLMACAFTHVGHNVEILKNTF